MRHSLYASTVKLGLEKYCDHADKGDDSSENGSETDNLGSQAKCSSNSYWSGNQKPESGVPCNIMGAADHLRVEFTSQRERLLV